MKRSEASLSPGFAQVVETIFEEMDVSQEFERLTSNLEIGDDRGDYGHVNRHLDRAESNARKAHRLYLKALLEQQTYELSAEKTLSLLRDEAHRDLQTEKEIGARNKAITDADVSARMLKLFPDEVMDQKEKRLKIKGMVEHCEHITELWKSRCRSLQAMLTQIRK